MNGEWRKGQLGDFIELKRGYDLPKSKRSPGRFPLVSSSGVSDWHNIAMAKGPGVVTGRYGTIGEVFFVEDDFWPLNTTLYVCDFKGNDPKFINYFLKIIDFQAYSDKAAVPGINRNHLHKAEVHIPDFETQKLIAYILGTIDDKIALNHHINQTLEEMAQALFKSWFVDFEPVRAKVAALELGEDSTRAAMRAISGKTNDELDTLQTADAAAYAQLQTTASLFPDKFEESELGMVPKGWEVRRIEEIAEKVGMGPFGSNIKVSTFAETGIPIINGQQLRETLLTDIDYKFVKEDHAKKLSSSCVKRGDIVFTHRGNIGQVSLIPKNSFYSEYIFSQSQFYLRPNENKIKGTYLIYFFKSLKGQHILLANASQVGVPSISKPSSYLKSIQVITPDIKVLEEFEKVVELMNTNTNHLKQETETLSTLRDTLLPKLLSGELSVSNSEVEAVAIG